MRGTSGQSLLGDLLERRRQVGEVGPVVGLEGPAHDQDVLDVSGGLQVGQRRLHAPPDKPENRRNTVVDLRKQSLAFFLGFFRGLSLRASL